MTPSAPPEKVDVPTGGCGCAGEAAYESWRGTQVQDRALEKTALGRLIVALQGILERMTRR